jgi:adenosylcobinamide-GDP ribazoletransferase
MIFRALGHELNLFFLALGYFSRIPMPKWIVYTPDNLNHASRYFTLVGWLLGFCVAGFYFISHQFFSVAISIWLCILASIILTGAFHEDGLADTADGLGGGLTREKKLLIMKDSRIGTYGASALVLALLGKFVLLQELHNIIIGLAIAYALSRMLAVSLLFDTTIASDPDTGKAKPMAQTQSLTDKWVLLVTGIPVVFLVDWKTLLLLAITLVCIRYTAQNYFNRQLGGVTGDCLGATQQISELCIYLLLITQGF